MYHNGIKVVAAQGHDTLLQLRIPVEFEILSPAEYLRRVAWHLVRLRAGYNERRPKLHVELVSPPVLLPPAQA